MIDTYAQDLGIKPFELGHVGLVRRDLIRSDRSPGQWEEDKDDIPAAEVAQRHAGVLVRIES